MLLLLFACAAKPAVTTECSPLRLATSAASPCAGIELCVETTTDPLSDEPERATYRTWFRGPDGQPIDVPIPPGGPAHDTTLRDLVCAAKPPAP